MKKLLVLLPALILLLSGCDDRSISVIESDDLSFSVFGALSIDEDRNFIRVGNLLTPFPKDSAEMDGVTVTFENVDTGTSTVLQDSIVVFNRDVTFNYIVEGKLNLNTTYKLTVSDDNASTQDVTSIATTPGLTGYEAIPASSQECDENSPEDCNPGAIPCRANIDFIFSNVKFPESIRMEVGVQYQGRTRWSFLGKVAEPEHVDGEDEMRIRITPRQLLVEVFPPPGIDNPGLNPRFLSPTVDCRELDSEVFQIRYQHFGKEWALIDPKLGPQNPAVSPLVDAGLGVFGAFREDLETFSIIK